MIYKFQVDDTIKELEKKGVNVFKEDYVIMASMVTVFESGQVYPLEIIKHRLVEMGTAYIMKRPEKLLEVRARK